MDSPVAVAVALVEVATVAGAGEEMALKLLSEACKRDRFFFGMGAISGNFFSVMACKTSAWGLRLRLHVSENQYGTSQEEFYDKKVTVRQQVVLTDMFY